MLAQNDTSSPEQGPSRSVRATLARFLSSPFVFFLLCALTFIASHLFLSGLYREDLTLWVSRKLRLWHVLVAMNPTLWVASLLVVFNERRTRHVHWTGPRRLRMEAGVNLFLAVLLFLSPMIFPVFTPESIISAFLERAEALASLPDFPIKFHILNILGCTVATLLTASMLGVQLQLSSQFQQSPPHLEALEAERLAEDVQRYQQLRSWLERLLGLSAANLGATILVTGALRNLLSETAPGPPEFLPSGAVMAVGAYYTWLLAITYLPVRKTLNDVGQALTERLVRQSLVTRVTSKQWFEEQKTFRTYLGLQGAALQDIHQSLSVLTPLLASISTLALGPSK